MSGRARWNVDVSSGLCFGVLRASSSDALRMTLRGWTTVDFRGSFVGVDYVVKGAARLRQADNTAALQRC
jgi:hypothetical protein